MGVTAMALSHNNKYLAICERAEQAICFVYEVNTLKRRRILTSSESVAKEFVDVKFAHSDEKMSNFLLTLVSIQLQTRIRKVTDCYVSIDGSARLPTSGLAVGQAAIRPTDPVRHRCDQEYHSQSSVIQPAQLVE